MPTVVSTIRSTGPTVSSAVLQAKRVIDMADKIALLQPSKAPLLRLLSGGTDKRAALRSVACYNSKFDWLEDDLQPEWDAINYGAGYASGDTSIVVDNGAYFAAGDNVAVPRTGEVFFISSVSSNTLTVIRGDTAAALVDNDPLLIIGNANQEGATSPALKTILETEAYNYTQIFRTPFGVTGTLKASKTYGGSDLAYTRAKKAIEHAVDIEKAFLFGRRNQTVSGVTHPRRATGGLLQFISTYNQQTGYADLDEDEFNSWLKDLLFYGSDKKVVLCSGTVLAALNAYARDAIRLNETLTKKFGINISEYFCPFGLVYLVYHKKLTGTTYGGYAIGVDMENVRRRFLNANGENRDTKLKTNIQANNADSEEDEYITETGIEVKLPATHGTLTGITGTA